MVTKALGFAALVGVATSVSAANLTLSPGQGPAPLGTDITGGPVGAIASSFSTLNQGGGLSPGFFTVMLESAVTTYESGTGKLAFWYKVTNFERRGIQSDPINFMGVFLPPETAEVRVNQQGGTGAGNAALTAGFNGGAVGFQYGPLNSIDARETGAWSVLFTDFTSYGPGTVRVVGPNAQQDFFGFTPVSLSIPEPATYAGMFALGLAGFAAYRRFRA